MIIVIEGHVAAIRPLTEEDKPFFAKLIELFSRRA